MPLDLARARRARAHRARAAGGAERRGRGAVRVAGARGGRRGRRPRSATARASRAPRAPPACPCSTAPPRRATTAQGANRNARLFVGIAKSPVKISPGTDAVQVPDAIGVEPGDIVLPRHHGLGPMTGTQLDPMLRNLGVRTIVGVGVSVNIGITSLAFDAVNWGYQIVLPRDAVAGVPRRVRGRGDRQHAVAGRHAHHDRRRSSTPGPTPTAARKPDGASGLSSPACRTRRRAAHDPADHLRRRPRHRARRTCGRTGCPAKFKEVGPEARAQQDRSR